MTDFRIAAALINRFHQRIRDKRGCRSDTGDNKLPWASSNMGSTYAGYKNDENAETWDKYYSFLFGWPALSNAKKKKFSL